MANESMFRRLRLGNWKNFRKVDVEIGERLFLVGANGSGKSNLLDSFRFLRDLASSGGGFEAAVARRGGLGAVRCLAAPGRPDVEIEVEVEGRGGGPRWGYALAFGEDGRGRPQVRRERVSRDGETILDRPDRDDRKDGVRLTQTHIEQVGMNRPFRDLAKFFGSVRYLHPVPQILRDPERWDGGAGDPYGGDFLERIANAPEGRRNRRLKIVEDALRAAVPDFEELGLTRDGRGAPRLRGRRRRWRANDAWQSEEQFSDGELRLIGLLWAAMDGEGPLLLDNPELSLHPDVVRRFPQMLLRVRRPWRQVFTITHSPELLSDEGIGLDEALLCSPGAEGVDVAPAASVEVVHALVEGGHTLGDAVIPEAQPGEAWRLCMLANA